MSESIARQLFPSTASNIQLNGTNDDNSDDYSSSYMSDSSLEDDPGWEEEALKSGELFYVEENKSATSKSDKNKHAGTSLDDKNKSIYRKAMPKPTPTPEDEPFVKKTVLIEVQPATSYQQNKSSSLLANMLGIIMLKSSSNDASSDKENKMITVDALVPGGAALLSHQVDLDDVLVAVDNVQVHTKNIEKVLRQVNKPITLKLSFEATKSLPSIEFLNQQLAPIVVPVKPVVETYTCITTVLTPHASRKDEFYNLTEFHSVFYLTLSVHSETAAEFDDLLYSFPALQLAANPSRLAQIRGLFLTLSDLIKDSFSTRVLSSTLKIGDEAVHCAYYHVNTEVLIICLPALLYSLPQVHLVLGKAVRLLHVMFGTLAKAFKHENKQRLDHMFHIMLYLNASVNPKNTSRFLCRLPGVQQMTLSSDLQNQADLALAELESCDFDDGNKFISRRLYTVRGSCLFYDGYLVANHLAKEDLFDVYLYCFNHSLLTVRKKERIGLLIIWREFFLWSRRTQSTEDFYPETTGRCFLLVVGLKRNLLCVLLHLNGKLFPPTHTPRPDNLYVNSARAILINLDARKFNLGVECQLDQSSPLSLASVENFLTSHAKAFSSSSKPPLSTTPNSKFKLRFSSPLKFKSTDESKTTSRKSDSPVKKAQSAEKTGRRSRSLFREKSFSSQDSADNSPRISRQSFRSRESEDGQFDVTAGGGNSLFHYVKIKTVKGILVMPTEPEVITKGGENHYDIISNFHKYALILHQRLLLKNEKSDYCTEEGILFQYQPLKADGKKSSKVLQYWVVGRRMQKPYPHEFYVCYHNTAPQSMVELAFKSSFCV